jgi:hypothetical protein
MFGCVDCFQDSHVLMWLDFHVTWRGQGFYKATRTLFHIWCRKNKQVYISNTWLERNRVGDWLAWFVLLIHSLLINLDILQEPPLSLRKKT